MTFYDEATSERVELSVTTWANWVAKASGLMADLDLERGMRLRIDLPTHWLSTVFLGAAWNLGLAVSDTDDPDAVVCGPAGLERWAGSTSSIAVLACSLRPLGARFTDALPSGVYDVGVEIWSQPDAFSPWDPPEDSDLAWDFADQRLSQSEMWATAVSGSAGDSRLLSVANPASPPGIASFIEPLSAGGSVVLVTHAGLAELDPIRLEAIRVAERVVSD
ncbi:TIGR03089 family protein [soil metagenome]